MVMSCFCHEIKRTHIDCYHPLLQGNLPALCATDTFHKWVIVKDTSEINMEMCKLLTAAFVAQRSRMSNV